MDARFLLWHATHDRAHLTAAKRPLDFLVEHAPPECRESMLTNVRLHREIAAACKEQGLYAFSVQPCVTGVVVFSPPADEHRVRRS